MTKRAKYATGKGATRILGAKTFAAIAAVEGLRLSATSKKRLVALQNSELTPEERRAEVLRAYMSAKERR